MNEAKHNCAGRVWSGMSHTLCGRGAKYEHDGKWYCKTHHPPTVTAKNAARNAEYDRKWREADQARQAAELARQEQERRAALFDELTELLRDMLELRDLSIRSEVHPKGEVAIVTAARAVLAKAEAK